MRKTAVFVEGQTELIFVREFLLKVFEYQNIDLECRTLFTDQSFLKAEYDFPNPAAAYHFQVINVGNDNSVLSRILKREQYMWNTGYERIIGLRDMYSKNYREASNTIQPSVNQRFIDGIQQTIQVKASQPDKISVCFAIMETEAWFLGLYELFEKMNNRLTVTHIHTKLDLNLAAIDPETTVFHPAKCVEEIYALADKSYDKRKGDIEAIASLLEKQDFFTLQARDVCASFNLFFEKIQVSSA